MGNHMKGYSGRHCRRGLYTKYGSERMQKPIRSIRRKAKQELRRGEEPPPCTSRGSTD